MTEKQEWQNKVLRIVDAICKRNTGRELDKFTLAERVKVKIDGKRVK
jgi:hypothetical protein